MNPSEINDFIKQYSSFLIVQADNPDGDSIASALALEQILMEMEKKTHLYCSVDIPQYLRYLEGWDRVSSDVPNDFDAVIIVDTTAINLFEAAEKSGAFNWIKAKPCLVIDHHETKSTLNFTQNIYQKEAVSTTELIYDLASSNKWSMNHRAKELIAVGILSDSLGLISESTTANSIRILSELVASKVSLAKLDNDRKKHQRKSPEILAYKGELLTRVKYSQSRNIAYIIIPWAEIEKYSHQYNPSMLVLDEMRQVEKVQCAIAFKTYPDSRITAKVRANLGYPIAASLAENFGGGGHKYASGFRVTDGSSIDDVLNKTVMLAEELIGKVADETL